MTSTICGKFAFAARIARAPRPSSTAGSRGVRVEPGILASALGARQAVVPGHREHQPDRRRVDRQGADRDRQDDVGQEETAPGRPERVLDDRRHPPAELPEARVGQVGRGPERAEDQQRADQADRRQGAEDRPGGLPPRVVGLLGERPAVSKPYITNEGTSAAARNGPR